MKITVKTLKGEVHQLEVTPEQTIEQLKQQIAPKINVEPESQKLIYKGKHLENPNTIKDVQIIDGDTIIAMTLKKYTTAPPVSEPPKAEAPKAQTTPQDASKPSGAPKPPGQPVSGSPAPQPGPLLNPNVPLAQPHAQLDPTNELVYGAQHKADLVKELAEMGFPAADCEKALAAAFFNKDRAVDYLLNGIPNLPVQQPPAHPPAQPGQAPTGTGPAQPAMPPGGGPQQIAITPEQMAQIQQLVTSPEFENIRAQIAQNPQVLQQLMVFLQTTRPELYQLFQQNPQLLLAILTGQFQAVGAEGDDDLPEGENIAPELTQEDMAAIQAMKDYGFSEAQCMEAYLICDKNKELAINYLLDNQMNAPPPVQPHNPNPQPKPPGS